MCHSLDVVLSALQIKVLGNHKGDGELNKVAIRLRITVSHALGLVEVHNLSLSNVAVFAGGDLVHVLSAEHVQFQTCEGRQPHLLHSSLNYKSIKYFSYNLAILHACLLV